MAKLEGDGELFIGEGATIKGEEKRERLTYDTCKCRRLCSRNSGRGQNHSYEMGLS